MNRYRSVWTTSLVALGVVGAGVAVVDSPASAAWLFAIVSLMAGFVGASVVARMSPEPVPWQTRVWSGTRCGVAAGLYLLALVGLDKVLPVWLLGAVIVLTLALFATGAIRMYRRNTSPPGPPAGPDPAQHQDRSAAARADGNRFDEDERRLHQTSTEAHAMSTLELCEAWPASFTELEHCTDPAARVWIATRRQIYLDELERRDPAAVQAWLRSDARAASNPRRFLTRKEGGRR